MTRNWTIDEKFGKIFSLLVLKKFHPWSLFQYGDSSAKFLRPVKRS